MGEPPDKTYWFRAKTFGWGFGAPTCWQGWAVLLAYVALIVAGSIAISVEFRWSLMWLLGGIGAVVAAASLLLLLVCWWKGPKLRWRSHAKDTGDYPVGRCQNCGYDLTGNVTGVCSECGRAIEDR